jgi:hypothetical protein
VTEILGITAVGVYHNIRMILQLLMRLLLTWSWVISVLSFLQPEMQLESIHTVYFSQYQEVEERKWWIERSVVFVRTEFQSTM